MTIRGDGPLTYSVTVDGKPALGDSKLGLKFKDGVILGANTRINRVERDQSDTTWENKFGKRRIVRDHHNELRVFLVEQSGRPFEIVVRAFDGGIGFRYVLPAASSLSAQDYVLDEEQTQFSFPTDDLCYAGTTKTRGTAQNPIGYVGSQESEYQPMHLGDLPTNQVLLLPLLVKTPGALDHDAIHRDLLGESLRFKTETEAANKNPALNHLVTQSRVEQEGPKTMNGFSQAPAAKQSAKMAS